jgi:hypothetical protein
MQKNYERSFYQFGKEARKMHLQINEGKKMPVTKKTCTVGPTYLEIGPYKFENVYSFTYLGSEFKYKNNISFDNKKRNLSANKVPLHIKENKTIDM